MSRSKKNKLFDLFKTGFKITLFYKPTMADGDEFYYLILDDVVKLKIKDIQNVFVIDDVIPITSTYINPIYEKIVRHIMSQDKVTVLMSLTGNALHAQQACIACNAPVKEDERYITIPLGYYRKLKAFYNDDVSKYGFYILSVSDDDSSEEYVGTRTKKKEEPKTLNDTPIGVEPPLTTIGKIIQQEMKNEYRQINIEPRANNSIACRYDIDPDAEFVVELNDDGIYIKDFLQKKEYAPNLIKILAFVRTFEKFKSVHPNIYILNVSNQELFGICNAKGFTQIYEEQRLPMNKLFKQAFHGYGTFQIV